MKNKLSTGLIFDGNAEEAINLYTSLFKNLEIKNIHKNKVGPVGDQSKVVHAKFSIKGQEIICIDRSAKNSFLFTPATSLYINCDSKHEIETLFKELSKNGRVFIDLTSYGFSDLYGWVEDKFGVSWQLNLD